MNEWLEYAKTRLGTDDEVQKNYVARHDGKYGYIVMSKKEIVFIEERGLLRHTYHVTLEIPYETIGETSIEGSKRLIVTGSKRQKHIFATDFASASTIDASLKELIDQQLPKIS